MQTRKARDKKVMLNTSLKLPWDCAPGNWKDGFFSGPYLRTEFTMSTNTCLISRSSRICCADVFRWTGFDIHREMGTW